MCVISLNIEYEILEITQDWMTKKKSNRTEQNNENVREKSE